MKTRIPVKTVKPESLEKLHYHSKQLHDTVLQKNAGHLLSNLEVTKRLDYVVLLSMA